MQRIFLCFFILLYTFQASAQYSFHFDSSRVETENGPLALPWAGGINSAQYHTMDLNGDDLKDLVVFDRFTNKLQTFLNSGDEYIYAPQYELFFPADLEGWVIFKDYNCDGRKDIFTNTLFGIKVYRNVSTGDYPAWEVAADPVFTSGSSGQVNLQVNITDIPGIADLDNDGDLDILVYNFASGGYIRHHRNMSVEKYGNCDHLEFERVSTQWGEFEECECDFFAFGSQTCADVENSARIKHAGGKSIALFDHDGDGDQDLIMSQEDCNKLYYLENQGNADDALMLDFSMDYPQASNPAHFELFPAAFFEDVNFDNLPDLIASPNLSADPAYAIDFSQSSWLYINTGTASRPEFRFTQKNFLQDKMIDEGSYAKPFFGDYDGDGDQDLFIAANGFERAGKFYGKIAVYENTGNAVQPQFQRKEQDYLGLSNLELVDLKPLFADINRDGLPDLVFSCKRLAPVAHQVYYLINQGTAGAFEFNLSQLKTLPLSISASDNPFFYDVNGDGLLDVLLGKQTGRIEFHRNNGSAESPSFILEHENFAGIADNFRRRSPSPLIADLDGDGKRELVAVDNSGVIRVVEDFLSAEPEYKTLSLMNPVLGETDSTRFGRYSQLAAADLYQTGLPDLMIGSASGGVYALKNSHGTSPNESAVRIHVSPNPYVAGDQIRIMVSHDAAVRVVSMLGQTVHSARMNKDEILLLDPAAYAAGLYVIRAAAAPGNTDTAKLLILR